MPPRLFLGQLKDLGCYTLIHARDQIKEPSLTVALLGFGNSLDARVVETLLLGTGRAAFLAESGDGIDDFFFSLFCSE